MIGAKVTPAVTPNYLTKTKKPSQSSDCKGSLNVVVGPPGLEPGTT